MKVLMTMRAGIGINIGLDNGMFPYKNSCIIPKEHAKLFSLDDKCKNTTEEVPYIIRKKNNILEEYPDKPEYRARCDFKTEYGRHIHLSESLPEEYPGGCRIDIEHTYNTKEKLKGFLDNAYKWYASDMLDDINKKTRNECSLTFTYDDLVEQKKQLLIDVRIATGKKNERDNLNNKWIKAQVERDSMQRYYDDLSKKYDALKHNQIKLDRVLPESQNKISILNNVLKYEFHSIEKRKSPPPPPEPEVILYNDIGFKGESQRMKIKSGPQNVKQNDKLSSIRIPNGWTVIAYEHVNGGGKSITLNGDRADLRKQKWNDKISSLKVMKNTNKNFFANFSKSNQTKTSYKR